MHVCCACVLCMCIVHVYRGILSRFVSFRFVSFRFISFHFISLLIQQVTGIQSNSRSGEMTTRMMIKLPTCIIKDILSYFEMDLYQGKRGNWYIFNEGVYDSLKLMFPKVRIRVMKSTQPVYDVEESVWRIDEVILYTRRVHRTNSLVTIQSKTRNGIESPNFYFLLHTPRFIYIYRYMNNNTATYPFSGISKIYRIDDDKYWF